MDCCCITIDLSRRNTSSSSCSPLLMNWFVLCITSISLIITFCCIPTSVAINNNLNNNNINNNRVYCSSIDIRNTVAAIERYSNCTIVEGSVQIVLLDRSTERDFMNISFPELREITEYLLIYHVKGLKTLSQLFPNLAVIRGNVLFDNRALVVYANARLQELGLKSLTHVIEGSVFIYKNPSKYFRF